MDCPKCSGTMYLNEDGDLRCRMCGKVIVLTIRRDYDSREGKIRDKKKKAKGRREKEEQKMKPNDQRRKKEEKRRKRTKTERSVKI